MKAARGSSKSSGKGPFKYANYEDNHVIWDEASKASLAVFVNKSFGNLVHHKFKNAHSSHSEDALTWSCFNTLSCLPHAARLRAFKDVWKLCFQGSEPPIGLERGVIHVGKTYPEDPTAKTPTEVDASIESERALVFVEAKLYSPMSPADPNNPIRKRRRDLDQIALKLRVGLREAAARHSDFYFILLDIAPMEMLRSMKPRVKLAEAKNPKGDSGFVAKWRTAYWFARYKYGRRGSLSPLKAVLGKAPAITDFTAAHVSKNMGWLTWADLYKAVMRAVIA